MMFCAIGRSSRRPGALAVFRHEEDAGVDRVGGGREARSAVPSSVMLPPSGRSMPNRTRASSVRPAPTRPARPRISPAWRSRLTSWCGIGRTCARPRTESTTSPRGRLGRHVGDLEVAADHEPDHRVVVDRVAFERAHQLAVAQHDDAVAGLDHLVAAGAR